LLLSKAHPSVLLLANASCAEDSDLRDVARERHTARQECSL
jgi:hypothetical protein